MRLWESVRIALRALHTNKMRTALTMLGIIIGVAAVIAMVAIGQGAANQISQQFASMGTNLLMITRNFQRVQAGSTASQRPLTPDDAKAIAKKCQDTVAAISEVSNGNAQVKMGDKAWGTQVQGVSPDHPLVAKWEVEEGRFFTDQENTGRARVAVIGRTTIENLTGDRKTDVIGQTLLLNQARFEIIGILKEKGSGFFGQDQDDVVMIPVNTAMRRVFNRTWLNSINVSCRTEGDMNLATEEINTLLRERHKIRPPYSQNDDFMVRSQSQILAASAQSSATMTSLLGGIALVSLLVGGIGIMNIMLVSVTERTREIGIRKAVGATGHNIMIQFLIEAMVISLLGGFLGIALGVGLAQVAAALLKVPAIVQPMIVLLAVVVSGGVGIFFGIYPARQAARLNPIDALRFE
jgi:putative ABC transport system permease protein